MPPSHHAILYFVSDIAETPFDSLALSATSEIREFHSAKFSIAEVRDLIATAYGRPFEKATRTIIIRTLDIGIEAQHALLKVLEEPPLTTRFILIIKQGSVLLPTVLSRLALAESNTDFTPDGALDEQFKIFLQAPLAERLATIAAFTKDKDTAVAEALDRGLRQYVDTLSFKSPIDRGRLLWCQSHLRMHGASRKMLWEEIALTLPVEVGRHE